MVTLVVESYIYGIYGNYTYAEEFLYGYFEDEYFEYDDMCGGESEGMVISNELLEHIHKLQSICVEEIMEVLKESIDYLETILNPHLNLIDTDTRYIALETLFLLESETKALALLTIEG